VEEKDLSMLWEKGNHTPAKRKVQQLKNKQRIIKHIHDVFFFTLTHYNASHDRGRKMHQSVVGKWQPHTCKEKKYNHLKHQHSIIKFTQNAFFFTLTHYNASYHRRKKMHQSVTGTGQPYTCKEKSTTINKNS